MAPFVKNATGRLWIDYVTASTGGYAHSMMLRFLPPSEGQAWAQAVAGGLLGLIGAARLRIGWRVVGARASDPHSDVSLPVPLSSFLASFVGTSTTGTTRLDQTMEHTWQGRCSATGRRVSIGLFGIVGDVSSNGRWAAGGTSPAWIATTCNLLNTAGTTLRTIDGGSAVCYNFVNTHYNSYWQKRIRIS